MAHQVLSLKVGGSDDKFLVLRMTGQDGLNQLGQFRVETVGALIPIVGKPMPIVLPTLLGAKAEVKMDAHDNKRYFHGHVTQIDQGERHGRYFCYDFTLRPWLWFATRTRNSRVFQKKSVKDIVTEVLSPYGGSSEWRLVAASLYPKLDYCVQYDESDFDFVSRLLQRAGINYFFEHSSSEHKLIFVDGNAKFQNKDGSKKLKWSAKSTYEGSITNWSKSNAVRFKKVVTQDHDYLATAKLQDSESTVMPGWQHLGNGEYFDYPADAVQNSQLPEAQTTTSQALSQRTTVVKDALSWPKVTATCQSNDYAMAVGAVFEMTDHPMDEETGLPSQNGKYVIVGARYAAEFSQHEAIEDLDGVMRGEGFRAQLSCASSSGPDVRPDVTTPKPMMRGPQTALVVGAKGNEIETDKNGRVKIQFFWDREGKKNENSSCWVRVASPWASQNFGMISIPRVGDEVIVDFIDGDPDKPIVVGSVYNDANPPIWELPANATMSGLKSRTSKKGDFETSNELRFEDKKDKEHIWLQAERDFYRYVKKKAFDFIGDESMAKKKKSHKEAIVENWFLDVGKDVQHNFGKDVHLTVAGDIFYKGGATWQIDLAKDMTVKVGGAFGYQVTGDSGLKSTGKLLLTSAAEAHLKGATKVAIEGAQVSIKASGGIVLDCSAGVKLVCGGSSVALSPAGVDIVGGMVKINSGGGGGSGSAATEAKDASPAKPAKLQDITAAKASDYDKNFENPYKKSQ